MPPRPRTQLYLITPPEIADAERFAAQLGGVLEAGDAACLQVRIKPGGARDDAAQRAVALACQPVLAAAGAALFINDDPHLAADMGADGVHLGAQDMGIAEARALLGPDAIIGATARNERHTAMQAGEDGADYVAFGAFAPSTTKSATAEAGPELLDWWQSLFTLPCVAIGGITPDRAEALSVAGADFIAASGAVWGADDPSEAVRAFNRALDAAHADPRFGQRGAAGAV